MKIALVGAFDRNNYGDILMPIVMKNQIEKNIKQVDDIEFGFFGLSDADMEYTGGYNTQKFSNLYKFNYDVVIYVGGEILTSKYTGMYLNLQTSRLKIFKYKVSRRLFNEFTENVCRKKFGCKSLKPWIVDKDDLKCKALIYNTVGGQIYFGTNEKNRYEVENNIRKVDYISIREEKTFEEIKSINENAQIYPDSVISLEEYISLETMEKNVSEEIKKEIREKEDYFVFQVNKKQGNKHINEIVNQITLIKEKTNMNCILLPIGYAQGHEDNVVLKKIKNKLDSKITYMPDFNNVYETMYIIKNSKLYIGTSLHGAITAISYNIPHIALTSNIKKLIDFLTTWKTTPIVKTEINEMAVNVEKIIQNYDSTKKIVEESNNKMQILEKENFNKINKIIEEIANE